MSIQFIYGGNIVVLRDPELSNSESGQLGTAHIISMTGSVRAYRKSVNAERFLLNFVELDCGETEEMIAFVKATSGQIVSYVDWNAVTYNGYIVNNPFDVTQSNRTRRLFTVEFEVLETILAPSTPEDAMLYEDDAIMLYEDDAIMIYEG